tara:strand:+ start:1903 stop:2529 length:627 start_codon:yes stop_codon:yes gene_type:complete
MIVDVKKVLIPGFGLVAKLRNKLYHCTVCKEKKDDGFLVRLSKKDQTALAIVVNSVCSVQFVTEEGYHCKFESKVLDAAIPLLNLSYPEGVEGVSVRKQERISVSFWTAILGLVTESGMQRLKPVGEGSIVDMTIDGCRVMTNIPYKVNDTIFLSFDYQEGKDPISFDGIVRRVSPAPHGLVYYGVQYFEPESELLEAVQFILENPDL